MHEIIISTSKLMNQCHGERCWDRGARNWRHVAGETSKGQGENHQHVAPSRSELDSIWNKKIFQ